MSIHSPLRSSRCALAAAVMASLLAATASADSVWLDKARIVDEGNAADTTGYGEVDYTYNIGKYEVTAGQYTVFLNAVAANDTYSLYNTNMANTSTGSGISRSGSAGSYTYLVNSSFINRPVNYVSFWSAARFANWLENGQQGAGTTEYGTYSLGGVTNPTNSSVTRNAGHAFAVTNENEWYKAAYYDPNKNGTGNGGYWLYPTQSNNAPGQDLADTLGNNANYSTAPFTYPIDGTNVTTLAREFENSDSAYGTFDQAGNVAEWNESITGSNRGIRGGGYDQNYPYLVNYNRYNSPANVGLSDIGFRITELPEPASLTILAIGAVGMLARRNMRRSRT
jgi:formylglycine-generating enzyme